MCGSAADAWALAAAYRQTGIVLMPAQPLGSPKTYIGHNCIGHNHVGDDCVGDNYVGDNYNGDAYLAVEFTQGACVRARGRWACVRACVHACKETCLHLL